MSNKNKKNKKNNCTKNVEGLKFSKFQKIMLGFVFLLSLALILINFICGQERFAVSMPIVVLDIILAVIIILPSIRNFSITKDGISVGTPSTDNMNPEEIEKDEKEDAAFQGIKLTKENIQKIKQRLIDENHIDKNSLENRKIQSNKITTKDATFNFYSAEKQTFVKIITAKTFSSQLHDNLFFRISRFFDFKENVQKAKLIIVLIKSEDQTNSLKADIERTFQFSEENGLSCISFNLADI